MAALELTRETYRDKVYGGWVGKQIGGTLGSPLEGKKEIFSLSFYDPIPGQATANEDLDFQLVWLHALRKHGIGVSTDDLTDAWLEHVTYHWDEYGYATYNLRRGLEPPLSGSFNNWFKHASGAPIRSEIWAMIAPGAPQVAATYAHRDGSIDHAEEGVWAEMFWAAIESAAFFVSDRGQLLEIGLAMVPATSRVARAVRVARDSHLGQVTVLEARSRILAAVGHDNWSDAPQNVGFTVLGWLYAGGDFGAALCTAANCGYDADGNAGTLGAVLGIIRGKSGLPQDWVQPIGDSVVMGWGIVGLDVERTTAELVEHTVEVGEKVIQAKCSDVELVDELTVPSVPEPAASSLVALPAISGAQPADEPAADEEDAPSATGERVRRIELDPPASDAVAEPAPSAPAGNTAANATAAPAETPPDTTSVVADAPSTMMTESEATADDVSEPTASAEPTTADTGITSDVPAVVPVDAAPPVPTITLPAPPPQPAVNWLDNSQIKPLLVASPSTAVYRKGPFELTVDYGDDGPAIVPNSAINFVVAIRNVGEIDFIGHVTLSAPEGWQVAVPGAQGQRQMLSRGGMARYGFVVRVSDGVQLGVKNTLAVVMTPEKGEATTCDIVLLGGSCWWFVGPFPNMAEEGFDRVYSPEDKPGFENDYLGRAGGLIRWQKMAFKENVMELESLFSGQPGVAYGVTTLHVPATTDARIVVHSNDGMKVWLNKQRILQRHSHEPFRPTLGYGPASADVTLSPGDNTVMLKVVRCGAPNEFSFAVTDRNGHPLLDVGNTRW
jgi:ADP-ribosylglycohydrolase